jgi:hypothetical protein
VAFVFANAIILHLPTVQRNIQMLRHVQNGHYLLYEQ